MARTVPEPVAHLTWDQVFAERLAAQYLEPRTTGPSEVVRRCGVQAQLASAS